MAKDDSAQQEEKKGRKPSPDPVMSPERSLCFPKLPTAPVLTLSASQDPQHQNSEQQQPAAGPHFNMGKLRPKQGSHGLLKACPAYTQVSFLF